MRIWLPIVAACGGGSTAVTNSTAPKPATAAGAKCPTDAELAELVKQPWGAGAKVEVCVPLVRNGRTLWWLEGFADAPPDTMHGIPVKNALVTERRELAWHGTQQALGFGYMYMGQSEGADVDGDGQHEALYERTTGEGGNSINELAIVFFDTTPVVTTVGVGWTGDAGERTCNGTWSLVPGPGRSKRIQVDREGECGDEGPRETFERRGAEMVKVGP